MEKAGDQHTVGAFFKRHARELVFNVEVAENRDLGETAAGLRLGCKKASESKKSKGDD